MKLFLENLKFKPNNFVLANGSILLDGPDAIQYLNSQTTNNVKDLLVGKFQFNSILDISGKLISSFIVMKESETKLTLILREELIDSTQQRIEKFHISEDFEMSVAKKRYFLCTHSENQEGFKGKYFFESDIITDEPCLKVSSKEDFDKLRILTGVPEFGVEAKFGDLINNTFFDELSIDYKKGCYPGQETVSKIDTRRGAAYKPVLIVCEDEFNIKIDMVISIDKKKIGSVLNFFVEDNKTFIMTSLGREFRIDKSKINFTINDEKTSGIVSYYPYISTTVIDQAVELYDYAIELFHQNEDEEAINYFYKAIELNPLFEDAYESLGVLYGRMENYPKAIELMDELKKINPKCMMALTNLSLFHMKIGNIDIAEKFKADATILNFTILGDEAEQKKKLKEIEAKRLAERDRREGMFQQVLEMDAEDAMANNGMGEILLEKKRPEVAKEFFRQAINANKKYSVAYLGLSKALISLNIIDEARETLNQGIKVAGKNGDLMPANEMQSLLQKIKA